MGSQKIKSMIDILEQDRTKLIQFRTLFQQTVETQCLYKIIQQKQTIYQFDETKGSTGNFKMITNCQIFA